MNVNYNGNKKMINFINIKSFFKGVKKFLFCILMVKFSFVYAECNKEDLSIWRYNVLINSGSYNSASNTISIEVLYKLTSTGSKGSSICSGVGNFDKWHSRHSVIIGGNESQPQYVIANKEMPNKLVFIVSTDGLDKSALANGAYAITPSSYYDNGYSTDHSGNYSYFSSYNGSSSIISNMGPTYSYTKTEDRALECPVDKPSGYILQRRSYEVWSDGSSRNISDWYEVSRSCKAIPSQTVSVKNGMEEVNCDDYYGAAKGSYTGSVYKYGEYISFYNADSMSTSTVFNVKSVDVSSCAMQTIEFMTEEKKENCPSGSGEIKYYRYKAINSNFEIIYPYGDYWTVLTNTCSNIDVDKDSQELNEDNDLSLLENSYYTSTELQKDNSFINHLEKLSKSAWTPNGMYKLNIKIDDLSKDKYDKSKISKSITKFDSIIGKNNYNIKIFLPRELKNFVGNGDITKESISNKLIVLKEVYFLKGNVVIKYADLSNMTASSKLKEKELLIKLFEDNVDYKNIKFE